MVALDYGIPTDKEGIQLRLGVSRGFFRDEGIDLNIKIIFGGPEIAAAYDSGTLKMGELGTPPGLTAISRGIVSALSEAASEGGRFSTSSPGPTSRNGRIWPERRRRHCPSGVAATGSRASSFNSAV